MASAEDGITFAESDQTLDELDVRALTECMTTLKEAPGLYQVTSSSGSTYVVDARDRACECPDHRYRERTCKHLRRVDFATGARIIPRWIDRGKVDECLGIAVEGPRFASPHPQNPTTAKVEAELRWR